jgi:hypothetical protein
MGESTENPEWAKEREFWYSQTFVLLEIVKCLNEKETAFLEKKPKELQRRARVIRCINAWSVDLLKKNFEAFRFYQFPYMNIYLSLMNIKRMPMFSFAPPKRKEQQKEWTQDGKYREHYAGYDWGIDIDNSDLSVAHADAGKVKDLLDKYEIPYTMKFSGSKGFHFRVMHKHLPQIGREQLVPMLNELTTKMKLIDGIDSIDDSIIDDRRIFKVPYSYDRGNICLPLTDAQFTRFSPSMVKPMNVLSGIHIKNRGLLVRNEDLDCQKAIKNFWRLAEQFISIGEWQDG